MPRLGGLIWGYFHPMGWHKLAGLGQDAILFIANYMNDVEQAGLNFCGIEGPNQEEKWITADAPKRHLDWNQGGTYRSSAASDLEYDADHNFKPNSWSYD